MSSLVQRVINILKSPKTEWPVIAGEPATVRSLYIPYVLLLAAIGPVALVLGGGGTGFFRFSSSFLLRAAVWQYASALVSVALLALVINFLAPTFGATRDRTQAFKTAVYASTAAWIGAVGGLLGFGLGVAAGAGGRGVQHLPALPRVAAHHEGAGRKGNDLYGGHHRRVHCRCRSAVGASGAALASLQAAGWGGMRGAQNDVQVFDRDSPLGRLESAGRELEKAEKEGKLNGSLPGHGTGDGRPFRGGRWHDDRSPVRRDAEVLYAGELAGLPRQSISAERNAAMGMQVASARARYGEGDGLRLEITDTGGAAGFMALADWANIESSSEEGTRTERVGTEGDRLVKEIWDSASKSGEYTVVLGKRFIVEVEGSAGQSRRPEGRCFVGGPGAAGVAEERRREARIALRFTHATRTSGTSAGRATRSASMKAWKIHCWSLISRRLAWRVVRGYSCPSAARRWISTGSCRTGTASQARNSARLPLRPCSSGWA